MTAKTRLELGLRALAPKRVRIDRRPKRKRGRDCRRHAELWQRAFVHKVNQIEESLVEIGQIETHVFAPQALLDAEIEVAASLGADRRNAKFADEILSLRQSSENVEKRGTFVENAWFLDALPKIKLQLGVAEEDIRGRTAEIIRQ